MLWSLNYLNGPFWILLYAQISFFLGSPQQDTTLQMWPHLCWVERVLLISTVEKVWNKSWRTFTLFSFWRTTTVSWKDTQVRTPYSDAAFCFYQKYTCPQAKNKQMELKRPKYEARISGKKCVGNMPKAMFFMQSISDSEQSKIVCRILY